MCGIVGYIGSNEAVDFLVDGLHRLEYRGYDSAGVATIGPDGSLKTVKTVGRIQQLQECLAEQPAVGAIGIGHTRWATHGAATDVNAHPHLGGEGSVAVVHNGVIENFSALRSVLQQAGYTFRSDTDTEVIAHLIDHCLRQNPPEGDLAAVGYRPLIRAVEALFREPPGLDEEVAS